MSFRGKTYQHARYLAKGWIYQRNKRDPDVHYTLLKPKRKTIIDELTPLFRWFWYLFGAFVFALLFWLVASQFIK
jgi:hypothetical protein